MGSLIEELRRREAAAREEVARVLEDPAVETPPAGRDGRPERETRPASPIGAVTVPLWPDGTEASVLPQAYQDLLDVAADAGRALRAGEFAAAAGLATVKAKVLTQSGPGERRALHGSVLRSPSR